MSEFSLHECVRRMATAVLGCVSVDEVELSDMAEQLLASVASPRSSDLTSAPSNALNKLKAKSVDPAAAEAIFVEMAAKDQKLALACAQLVSRLSSDWTESTLVDVDVTDNVTPTSAADPLLRLKLGSVTTPRSREPLVGGGDKPTSRLDFILHDMTGAAAGADSVFSDSAMAPPPLRDRWRAERAVRMVAFVDFYDGGRNTEDLSFKFDDVKHLPPTFAVAEAKALSEEEQEHVLVYQLLELVFRGQAADDIRPVAGATDEQSVTFELNPGFAPPLRDLTQRCLELALHHHIVEKFCDKHKGARYGHVNQALTRAMYDEVQQLLWLCVDLYEKRLAQPSEGLSLMQLWFQLQPSLHAMRLLSEIACHIDKNDLLGGAVLSYLHDRLNTFYGDERATKVLGYLTRKAAVPFYRKLRSWVYHGRLEDPFFEMLIWDSDPEAGSRQKLQQTAMTEFDGSDSLERRYVLVKELCPDFLLPVADDILSCGKYLNIMNACGGERVKLTEPSKPLEYDAVRPRAALAAVERAKNEASRRLVQMLAHRFSLSARLASMKRFFLIAESDWMLQFLDSAESELNKRVDDVHIARTEKLLEAAMRSGSGARDPFVDDLRCELSPNSITKFLTAIIQISDLSQPNRVRMLLETESELTGLECFALQMDTKWPVSIVLSVKALTQYQILFRQLLRCKVVERLLVGRFKEEEGSVVTRMLSYAMLLFVRNYEFYCSAEIVEPNWRQLSAAVDAAADVDEVLHAHGRFLDNCTKDCMLTDSLLLSTLDQLLSLCEQLARNQVATHKRCLDKFKKLVEKLIEDARVLGSTPQNKGTAWLHFVTRLQMNRVPSPTVR